MNYILAEHFLQQTLKNLKLMVIEIIGDVPIIMRRPNNVNIRTSVMVN